jgi:hypothetical protein
MAERRILRLPELPQDIVDELFETLALVDAPLCKLHRNEPGWLVGEHMHVLFGGAAAGLSSRLEKELELLGEPVRSRERLRDGEAYL